MYSMEDKNKTTLNIGLSLLFICALLTSCVTEENNTDIFNTETKTLKLLEEDCSTAINFDDLNVETTWISGDKHYIEEYAACGLDNEEWASKFKDGKFMLRCLKDDDQRTELKEANGDEANLAKYLSLIHI